MNSDSLNIHINSDSLNIYTSSKNLYTKFKYLYQFTYPGFKYLSTKNPSLRHDVTVHQLERVVVKPFRSSKWAWHQWGVAARGCGANGAWQQRGVAARGCGSKGAW